MRRIHEQSAADRDFAFKIFGNQPVAAGGQFPGDGFGRIAGPIIPQVEQLAPRSRPAEAVDAGRWQEVMAFCFGRLSLGIRERRHDPMAGHNGQKGFAVKETVQVGHLQRNAFKADPARRARTNAIAPLHRLARLQLPFPAVIAGEPLDPKRYPVDG